MPEAARAPVESADCFEEQTVLDLVAGRLSEASLVRVEKHLGSCEMCTDLVAVSAPLLNSQRVTATLQFGAGTDDKQTVALDEEESPRRRQPALAAGVVLRGTYEIVRRIGQGGMGDVYEAKHARLTGRYAVKVLPPEFALNEAVLSRFHREAQIASGLQHPNIVQVIDFHETDDGTPYLVMEFLDGEDLAAWMTRRGPIPLSEAMPIIEQIGAALTAVHRRGIVHRDVKPQNVFLIPQENGRTLIKLVDFGLSKAHAPSLIVTRQPMLLGTPQYMAPEQALARADDVGPATDQFALAAIVYQMLSGRPPFVGERVSSVLYQIVHEDPPPLGPDVDARVEAALRRALAKRAADRFPSMTTFVEALRESSAVGALVPLPGSVDSITRSIAVPVDPSAVDTRRRRSLVVLGGVAFLATLAVLFVLRPGLGTAPTPLSTSTSTSASTLAPRASPPQPSLTVGAATPPSTQTPHAASPPAARGAEGAEGAVTPSPAREAVRLPDVVPGLVPGAVPGAAAVPAPETTAGAVPAAPRSKPHARPRTAPESAGVAAPGAPAARGTPGTPGTSPSPASPAGEPSPTAPPAGPRLIEEL